jgi:type II protein arginine methyltransferase
MSDLIPNWHIPMIRDTIRNRAFHQAIRKYVKPNLHVLDIGTGTGLLSMMAVRAG